MKSLQYINSIIASKKDIGLLVFRILIGKIGRASCRERV